MKCPRVRPLIAIVGLLIGALGGAPASAQLVTRGATSEVVELTSQTLAATLEDGLARVAVRQVFRYGGPREVEAIYTFALPSDAALTSLVMTTAEGRLEGVLAERKRARKVYDDIVRRQRDPALLEQVADGRFRLSVYPVAPGVDTIIELEYIQRAPLFEGAFHLTLPLGGDTARGAATSATVEVRSTAELGEVTALLPDAQVVVDGPRRAVVSWEGSAAEAPPSGLSVTAKLADGAPSFAVETYRDTDGEAWFVAVFSPGTPAAEDLLPRDVLLVLDTSGSMRGQKLAQAQAAAHWLVDHLGERDRVNIVRFSTDVSAALPALTPVTPEAREALHAAIDALTAQGGTALGDALAYIASMPQVQGRARTVALLTDGRPTVGERDAAALVGVARRIGDAGLRLHTFGVGEDVDDGLLRGAAAAGQGRAEVFANALEVEPRLRRFLSRTAAPLLRDLRLSARGVTLNSVHPRVAGDAYLGEQVVLTGRFSGAGPAAFDLVGDGADGACRWSDTFMIPEAAAGRRAVALQHATLMLADLAEAERMRVGLTDAAYRAASEAWRALDRGAYSTSDELIEEMVRTSLLYGVQCAYTSFIAVTEADAARLAVVDVTPPAGESPFQDMAYNDVIGVGGGAGGRYSGRFARRDIKASGGWSSAGAVHLALDWLARARCDGPWTLRADALALLALLGDGHTAKRGDFPDTVLALTQQLVARFDVTTLDFVDPEGAGRVEGDAALDRLLATLALLEAYDLTKAPLLRKSAQQALARAQELLAAPKDLSPEALLVAFQVRGAASAARFSVKGLAELELEVARRFEAGDPSLLVAAARLRVVAAGAERAAWAERVAEQAIAASDADEGPRAALRRWLITDALRAAETEAWAAYHSHSKRRILESQRSDGELDGAWQPPSTGADRSDVAATTAANVLTLESPYRL
ncbi:MAG: VIT and VWA domain-containing protein [Planctomycetota bacterium]